MTALKVFGWQGMRNAPAVPRGHTREIVAAPSKAAAAQAAGKARPGQLFNFSETGNAFEIAVATAAPGQVFYRPLDAFGKAPFTPAPPVVTPAPRPARAAKPKPAPPVAVALAPCPCCGGQGELLKGAHEFVDAKVVCQRCGMESGLASESGDEAVNGALAVREWNRRTLTPEAARTVRAALAVVRQAARQPGADRAVQALAGQLAKLLSRPTGE